MSVRACWTPSCYSTDGVRPIDDAGKILLCKLCRSYHRGARR